MKKVQVSRDMADRKFAVFVDGPVQSEQVQTYLNEIIGATWHDNRQGAFRPDCTFGSCLYLEKHSDGRWTFTHGSQQNYESTFKEDYPLAEIKFRTMIESLEVPRMDIEIDGKKYDLAEVKAAIEFLKLGTV